MNHRRNRREREVVFQNASKNVDGVNGLFPKYSVKIRNSLNLKFYKSRAHAALVKKGEVMTSNHQSPHLFFQ